MNDGHPLFPAKSEHDDPPVVTAIQVVRREGGQNVYAPRTFEPEELTDLATLAEVYGGGTYELIARGEGRRHISARQVYVLPGAPKPLTGDAAPAREPVPVPPVLAPTAGGASWLPLLSALAPVLLQWLQGQQQMQQLMLQSSNNLLATVMQSSQQGSREYVQQMQSLHNSAIVQLAEILKARGGGSSGGSFADGVQFMQEFFAGQLEQLQSQGDGSDELQKTIEQIMKGIELFQQMKSADKPPAS